MREKVWRQVAEGQVRVVVGARSALFLPFSDLGLIVVDEEHDPAFKQEDRVFYNARDMAVVRGQIGDFPVVLASATPSIESRVNADQGRYARIELPSRFAEPALPDICGRSTCAAHPPARGGFLSPLLLGGDAARRSARGEQALLFLNRRGYAPLTLCRVCGHRFQCPDCSSLAGRAPLPRPTGLPPLRPPREAAGCLPGMRHARPSRRLRSRRRAHRRGGRRRIFRMRA